MTAQEMVENALDARITLRNEPVQARSTARPATVVTWVAR